MAEKGATEDEMVRWHHLLNGHEFEQTPEDSERQGNLVYILQSMGSQRVGHNWVIELLFNNNNKWEGNPKKRGCMYI